MERLGRRGAGWRSILALVGMVTLLVAYYWVHKPLDPALIGWLGGAALDVLTAVVIAVVAGGLGRKLTSSPTRLGVSIPREAGKVSRAEWVAIEGLLGLGVLGWAVLLLGMVGLYRGLVLWGALLVTGVICGRAAFGWAQDMIGLARRALKPEPGWTRFLAIFTMLMLTLALLHALTPPTAFDAINYHLVGPQRYLQAGRITAQPDNHFLGFPQGVEILYGVAMSAFERDTAAAPVHFLFGVFGLLAVGGLTRRYSNPATAWLAVTLLVGALSIWLLFGWPYVDLGMLAYGAAGLVAAVAWREQIRPLPLSSLHGEGEQTDTIYRVATERWLMLMGVFGGMGLGVKYTALGLLLAIVVYVVMHEPRRAVRNILILGAAATIAFLPWAIKGLALYQNPVYPFAFGGLNWDAGRANTFSTPGTGLLGSGIDWQLAILPIAATVFGVEKGDTFSFTAGVWLLTTPLLLALVWRWLDERGKALAKDSLLLGVPMLLFWLVMAAATSIGVQTRLMMMAMPTFATAGALGFYGLSRLPRTGFDVWFVARALIGLTLIFTLVDAVRDTVRMGVVPYLTANTSRANYLTDNLGIYINAMRQLETLPEGSQVRLMFEPRAYYCPQTVTCVPDILFDHWVRTLRSGKSGDEVFQGWKDGGDDYLLLFDLGYDFHKTDSRFPENVDFEAALEKWMTPIWEDGVGGYTLYAWRNEP